MWARIAVLLLISIVVVIGQKHYLLPQCQQPLHHGVQECTNSSSLRYYMDTETDTCLAFKYSGCGGNANRFETFSGCTRCFAADYSSCPLGSKPIPNVDNSTICRTRENQKCSGPDSYCASGAFFGTCCSTKINEKVKSDENIKEGCGAGQQKVARPSSYGGALLGKTCSSSFCPQKSTCHQGNYFAYCCMVL